MELEGIYRIGVIADTHDRWNPVIGTIFSEVDEIWHLGDVCEEWILDELREIQSRLTVVEGNNDYRLTLPASLTLDREGEKFHLIHIDPIHPPYVDWVLHGHTHVPRLEKVGRVTYFNPGSAGRANRGAPLSVGMLTKSPDSPWRAEVILLPH